MNDQLINFTEAQKHLGVSRSTLLRWLKSKRISGYKAGKKWKFYTADLNKVLLKESPVAYTTNDRKELLKLLSPLLPEKIKCKDVYSSFFWCEWQDITQWLMITIHSKGSDAQIMLTQNKPENLSKHLKIPVSKAEKIDKIWESWSVSSEITPPRPGKYDFVSGTNGHRISSLQLPANFSKDIHETYKLSKKAENKIASATYCDIYVYGQPDRHTAFTAYSILSKLLSEKEIAHPSVLTSERVPTYFLPEALQIYDDNPKFFPGAKFCLIQIEESDLMPPRGISTPPYRIAYSFGKRNNKLKESKNVIIIKAE